MKNSEVLQSEKMSAIIPSLSPKIGKKRSRDHDLPVDPDARSTLEVIVGVRNDEVVFIRQGYLWGLWVHTEGLSSDS